jgi:hypothetical protein
MKTCIWYDGTVSTGETWTDLEAAMRAAQARVFPDRKDFRTLLAHRAKVWSTSGKAIPTGGTSREFLARLERVGMVRLEEE